MTFHHHVLSSFAALALCSAPAFSQAGLPDDLALAGDDGVGGIEAGNGGALDDVVAPLELLPESLGGECGADDVVEPTTVAAAEDIDWISIGSGVAGSGAQVPQLSAQGRLAPNERVTVTVANARPSSLIILVVGDAPANLPFMGGTLVPTPQFIIAGLPLDDTGRLELDFRVTEDLPTEMTLITQVWVLDPEAPEGYSATNAVGVSTEP